MEQQCSERVYDATGFGRFYQCRKKAVVERNDKPYYKVHNPEYVEAKRDKKQTEWDEEWAKKKARREFEATAFRACAKINPENPQAVAESISDLYEGLKDALREICRMCVRLNPQHENCTSCEEMERSRLPLAKADNKGG